MTSHIPQIPIDHDETGVANLLRAFQDRSAFLLTFEERLQRVQQISAAFSHYRKLDDQCQLDLRARWAEALLALAIHPSATAAELDRKLFLFTQVDTLILPRHHPKLFILALSIVLAHDGAAFGSEIEIAIDGEAVGGPPGRRH